MANETIKGYVETPKLTTNLQNFVDWVITESGATFKTKQAEQAFRHGLYVGIKSYSHYQAAKNASKRAARAATPAKPVSRRRAKVA